jgi:hypothetical protein
LHTGDYKYKVLPAARSLNIAKGASL